MAKKKILSRIEIAELILVTPDSNFKRTFIGSFIRQKDKNGCDILTGTVVVNGGKIWSMAIIENQLRQNLDIICKMKLDLSLHEEPGIFTILGKGIIYLN